MSLIPGGNMGDEKLPWWKDGEQVRAILSDIGKWLIVIFSAWLAHDAKVDSQVAKHQAETSTARVGEIEKASRPVLYGEGKK